MSNDKKLILVIEDEPVFQKALATRLGGEGFTVIGALNGEEGLSLAKNSHPDLILLDLQMPRMGGIAMVKYLREDEWGKNAKVIVITNFSDSEKTQQALYHRVFRYFVKTDIKLEDLVREIKEFIK